MGTIGMYELNLIPIEALITSAYNPLHEPRRKAARKIARVKFK